MEINRPEEQQKAAVGAALDARRGGKTQLPKIRTAITAEQIAGTRLPPAGRPRLTEGQRPPRREEQAPQETTTTANMNINIPEEHQEAESRQPPIDLPLDTDSATQVAMLFGNLAIRNRATGVDLRRNPAFLASGTVFALHKDDPAAREERAKTGEPLRVRPLGAGSVLVRLASTHALVQVGADAWEAMGPTGFLSRMMPPSEPDPFLEAVDAANISAAFSLHGLDACDQSTPRMEAAIVQMNVQRARAAYGHALEIFELLTVGNAMTTARCTGSVSWYYGPYGYEH
eukprot:jgi/Tetstr1/453786/TSEL_040738.t1